MSTVLVTGASGFIGLPVARALVAQGHRVVGLDLVAPATPAQGVQHVLGGLSDVHLIYRLLEQWDVDTIVHGGAISGPMLARDNPYLVCKTNVVGTINLMEASRQRGLRRMVQLSSAAAFGATPPAPVADDAPLRAKDLYGASKGAADLLLEAYRRQYGLDVIALRIANAYGPGRRTRCAVRSMVANALAGRPTHFDWGADQARPYLYIDDAVAAVLAAVRADRAPQFAYNIAGAEFVPMPRVAAAVQAALPGAVISFQPGLDGLGYQREARDLRAAARALGFRPTVSIETGVQRYVDWMRSPASCREAWPR